MKPLQQLQKAKETLVVRYLFVGGVSYCFELSALLLLVYPLHQSRTVGEGIAYWIGLGLAFFLQKLVAFQNYEREVKILTRQGLLYAVLTVWNYIFTLWFINLFSQNYLIESRTVALVVMSAWNYYLYKRFIFRKQVALPV